MNERIRELANEAEDYADSIGGDFHLAYTKKFAELIVRECIAITNDQYFAYEAVEKLQEHFGVKE